MLTASTARYFAKQAYQLNLMTGRWHMTAKDKNGTELTVVRIAHDEVQVGDGEMFRTVRIAKSWASL